MPMELTGELKTTGGRFAPRWLTKGVYKRVIQPTYRATDNMGLTHHYQPQPQYPDQEEY